MLVIQCGTAVASRKGKRNGVKWSIFLMVSPFKAGVNSPSLRRVAPNLLYGGEHYINLLSAIWFTRSAGESESLLLFACVHRERRFILDTVLSIGITAVNQRKDPRRPRCGPSMMGNDAADGDAHRLFVPDSEIQSAGPGIVNWFPRRWYL